MISLVVSRGILAFSVILTPFEMTSSVNSALLGNHAILFHADIAEILRHVSDCSLLRFRGQSHVLFWPLQSHKQRSIQLTMHDLQRPP
jgi:hypothetical protein